MEATDLCLIPPLLLEHCKKSTVLASLFGTMSLDAIYKMFARIINNASCCVGMGGGHNIGNIHDLYECHKRHGIRAKHFREFLRCLHASYEELYPERKVEEHQTLKDVNALVTKIIDHENICTQAIIDDVIEELDREFVDKEYIKDRLRHVSEIINKRFGC